MAQHLIVKACLLLATAASAELANSKSRHLEDTAALVQTVALVKDESVEEKRPHIRPLRELLTEAGHKMAEKSEVAGQKWWARQQEKLSNADVKIREKIRNMSEPKELKGEEEDQRTEEQSIRDTLDGNEPRTDEQAIRDTLDGKDVWTEEDSKVEKFGVPLNLVVVDPLERQFEIKFRNHTKLRSLFNSLVKRTHLTPEAVSFVRGDDVLFGNQTAASAGLADGDVIELRSDVLQHQQEQKLLAEKAALRHAQVLLEKEEADRMKHLRKLAEKKQLLTDLAVQTGNKTNKTNRTKLEPTLTYGAKQEMRRLKHKKVLQEGHMVDLTFVDNKGKEVQVAFKRDNAFGPLQALVCKRMGLEEAETAFYWNNELEDVRIRANSSVHSLRLPNHAVIMVKPLVPPAK